MCTKTSQPWLRTRFASRLIFSKVEDVQFAEEMARKFGREAEFI